MIDDGPAIYSALYDERTKELREGARDYIAQRTDSLALRLSDWVEELLAKTYVKGVSDGFAQGVAAESKRQEEGNGAVKAAP